MSDARASGAGWRRRVAVPEFTSALVVLALVALFWSLRIAGTGGPLVSDAAFFHYPIYHWNFAQIASGTFPLWNPYQLCGIPTLATLQPGLLYPPHGLYALLPTHVAMALLSLLHLALLSFSFLLFARRVGLSAPAAILAALLVGLRGAGPGQVANPGMQESAAWLGVGLLAVLELARGRRLRGVIGLALATGLSLLAGFPQASVYAVYAWGFVLCGLLLVDRPGWRVSAGVLAAGAAGVALGLLLSAAQLLPALELVSVGDRVRGALPLHLMFPLGTFGFRSPLEALRTALSVRPALPSLAWSFGFVGLALTGLAFLQRRESGAEQRRTRWLALVFALLGILTLLIAMGPITPVFDLYLRLPEVASFRNPWRVLFIADGCFALLAAMGLDAMIARAATRSGGLGAAGRGGALRGALVGGLVLALALIEIFTARSHHYQLPYDGEASTLRPFHREGVVATLAGRPQRVWPWFYEDVGDISQKVASFHGVRSISDYDILTLRRQSEYFSYLWWGELRPRMATRLGPRPSVFYGHVAPDDSTVDMNAVSARSRLVQLAAARYLLVPRSMAADPIVTHYVARHGLRLLDNGDPRLVLLEDPGALPRTWVAHRVERAPAPLELLRRLSRPDYDPRALSYVETDGELPQVAPADARRERVELVDDGLHRVTIEVELEAAGLLVLADSFYPGWLAEVDGERRPILPTDHLFRGVAVPAGRHRVEFVYRPASVFVGAGASAVGLLALAGLARLDRRRPAFQRPAPSGS